MVGDGTRMNAFADGALQTGTVLSRSLSLLARNVVLFSAIAATAAAPEFLIAEMQGDQDFTTVSTIGAALRPLWPGAIASAIMSTLSTAIILHLVLHQAAGQPARVRDAIAATMARLPALIGVALVLLLALFGLPLLIRPLATEIPILAMAVFMFDPWVMALILFAPGLILLTLWYVAIPVCVMERRGVFRSLGRSGALTKGARSKLFALVALDIAVTYISGTFVYDAVGLYAGYWGAIAVQFALVSLQYAFTGVLVAVVFYGLCVQKRSFDPGRIAVVFD